MATVRGSNASLSSRLTRKVGPLPVWAWAAAILGAYLAYSHFRGGGSAGNSASSDSTAAPVGSTTGAGSGAQAPASGQGTPADNASGDLLAELYGTNAGTIDSLTNALLTKQSLDAAHPDNGAPAGSTGQVGPAGGPTPPPAITSAARGHLTQTTTGQLVWGGQRFTTKAGFNAWARAHGTTTDRELANHPQARALYSTLA